VAKNGQRLGELLLEADVVTKRQLAKAIQKQIKGDKRKLGDILIEMNYITVEDLTDAILNTPHDETVEPVIEEKVVVQPIDISEDAVMKTKFALDIKTMITAAVGIATLVGFWYALQADIQEAKELPKIGNIYAEEYPSRPEGYNWPRSYEQYKSQVGQLQTDMDDVLDQLDEYEETIKELEKEVTNLRIQLANKRDK
jgi:flagellar motility protein MotE (MotC chaperone)